MTPKKRNPQRKSDNLGRPPLPPDQRASASIILRVTTDRKSHYVRTARGQRKTLAAWMQDACDEKSDYPPKLSDSRGGSNAAPHPPKTL